MVEWSSNENTKLRRSDIIIGLKAFSIRLNYQFFTTFSECNMIILKGYHIVASTRLLPQTLTCRERRSCQVIGDHRVRSPEGDATLTGSEEFIWLSDRKMEYSVVFKLS